MHVLKTVLQEYHMSVKQFGPRSGKTFFVKPDLGSNCLQRLSADVSSTYRQIFKYVCEKQEQSPLSRKMGIVD